MSDRQEQQTGEALVRQLAEALEAPGRTNRHRLLTLECPPIHKFRKNDRKRWSAETRAHAEGCAYCQMMVEFSWREECPTRSELKEYASEPARFPNRIAMRKHVYSEGCARCAQMVARQEKRQARGAGNRKPLVLVTALSICILGAAVAFQVFKPGSVQKEFVAGGGGFCVSQQRSNGTFEVDAGGTITECIELTEPQRPRAAGAEAFLGPSGGSGARGRPVDGRPNELVFVWNAGDLEFKGKGPLELRLVDSAGHTMGIFSLHPKS